MDTVKVEVITTGEEEESLERAAVEVIIILQLLEETEGAGHLLTRAGVKGE